MLHSINKGQLAAFPSGSTMDRYDRTSMIRPLSAVCLGLLVGLLAGCGKSPSSSPPPAIFERQIDWIDNGVWLKVDTHFHSKFSDGRQPPDKVAAKAAEFGCQGIAITDHGDRSRRGGTLEYVRAIQEIRRAQPDLIVIAGLEWNVPPWGGDEHATVLFPAKEEDRILTQFRDRFDDHGRPTHKAELADEAFRWLESQDLPVKPVIMINHPSRKRSETTELVEDFRKWRAVTDLVVGFSGAPGHQGKEPYGDYRRNPLVYRWDPAAARIGDAWDQMLTAGMDVWAARAPSDFHNRKSLQDPWPGQFSETWVYAPTATANGILKAFRQGAFFANHGWIARQVDLKVKAEGLPREARPGEHVRLPTGSTIRVSIDYKIPAKDWRGKPNRVDKLELIAITEEKSEVIARGQPNKKGSTVFVKDLKIPPGGIVLRARGYRKSKASKGRLYFYTNPIRITAASAISATPTVIHEPIITALSVLLPLLLVGAVVAIGRSRSSVRIDRQAWPKRPHLAFGALFFAALAFYGSIVPLQFEPVPFSSALAALADQEVSFQVSRSDFAANVLLTIPVAYLLCGTLLLDSRRILPRSLAALTTLVVCLVLSIITEAVQYSFPPRVPSKMDVLAQGGGTLIGVFLWMATGTTMLNWARSARTSRTSLSKLEWVLQAYLVGVLIYTLLPFDLTLSPADLWRKVERGRVDFVPFRNTRLDAATLYSLTRDALLFVPIGMLIAIWRRPVGERCRPLPTTIGIGVLLVFATEVCQLFVMSRHSTVTDVILGSVGITIGALAMRLSLGRSEERTRSAAPILLSLAFLLAWSALIGVVYWSPFEFVLERTVLRERLEAFVDVPFVTLNRGSPFVTGSDFLRKALLFVPLGLAAGFIACRISPNRQGLRRVLLFIALVVIGTFAVGIELVQIAVPDRIPSLSDTAIYCSGAVLGMFIVTWIAGGGRSDASGS